MSAWCTPFASSASRAWFTLALLSLSAAADELSVELKPNTAVRTSGGSRRLARSLDGEVRRRAPAAGRRRRRRARARIGQGEAETRAGDQERAEGHDEEDPCPRARPTPAGCITGPDRVVSIRHDPVGRKVIVLGTLFHGVCLRVG